MNIKKWHLAGFFFILIAGTLLHYGYDLSGENRIMAYFAPINESVWEHLKLIFWPAFLFSLLEYAVYGKKEKDFFSVKMCAVFSAAMWIVVAFYTYSGILGFNLPAVDILIFIVSVAVCQWLSFNLFSRQTAADESDNLRSFVVLLLFALCFFVWTENPPMLGIFWG